MTEEQKKASRERMLLHNPMKDPDVVRRVRASYRATVSAEGYIHPNRGRPRPDAKGRMSKNNPMKDPQIAAAMRGPRPAITGDANPMKREGVRAKFRGDNHPLRRSSLARQHHLEGCRGNGQHMKDPDRVAEVLSKGRRTFLRNGRLSEGQCRMYGALAKAGIVFIPEHIVRAGGHVFFLDAFLPEHKIAVEYDGYYTHRTMPEKDAERDRILLKFAGVSTVRIVPGEVSRCVELVKERIGA